MVFIIHSITKEKEKKIRVVAWCESKTPKRDTIWIVLFALREARQWVKGLIVISSQQTRREGGKGVAAHNGGKTYLLIGSEEGSGGIVEGNGW